MKNLYPLIVNSLIIIFIIGFSAQSSAQCRRIRTVRFAAGYNYIPVASKYKLDKDSELQNNDLFGNGQGGQFSLIFYPNDDAYTSDKTCLFIYDIAISGSYYTFEEGTIQPTSINTFLSWKYGVLHHKDRRFPLYVPLGIGASFIKIDEANKTKVYLEAGAGLEFPFGRNFALYGQWSVIINNIEHVHYYPITIGIKI